MDGYRQHRRVHLLMVGMIVVCAAGCSRSARTSARPNVLLVTVDTLRADRLGCYGSDSAETPWIDRLAQEGTLFENAAAPMPSTRPSHASILTSLYPRDHGVLSNAETLGERFTTLPEVFADAGYDTAAFTGVKLLARGSGFGRGFATFESPAQGEQRTADQVVSQARAWLNADRDGRPFFLWVHAYDPHMPYAPPEPSTSPPPELPDGLLEFSRPPLRPLLEATGGDLPQSLLDYALAMYQDEVDYVDSQLARLLTTLQERETMGSTIIVFTADHGECFENGFYFEHGECLFEGAVRVPLVLRYPPAVATGERVDRQVELLDIAPTLLELVGLPVPPGFVGQSLLAPDDSVTRAAFLQHPLYRESTAQRRRTRRSYLSSVAGEPLRKVSNGRVSGLRTASWKYITSAGIEELYDLAADPGEQRDLASERPDLLLSMRRRLEQWMDEHPIQYSQLSEPDEDLAKTLEALGYL